MITAEAIIAWAKTIPLSLNIKLLLIAEKYWIIDVCPYLKCKFERPMIIFSEFNIPIYGRWYKPASGL